MTKPLMVSDTIYFGKHKGRQVAAVIAEDLDYVCWLREQQKKDDPRNSMFDYSTNTTIDAEVLKNKMVGKKYKPWNLPSPEIAAAARADAEAIKAREVAYAGSWGDW